jgi:hypothetical protein
MSSAKDRVAYAVRPDKLTPDDCPFRFKGKTFVIVALAGGDFEVVWLED